MPVAVERFWDGCRKHELQFQKCLSCGHVRWPASIICPMCYSKEAELMKVSGVMFQPSRWPDYFDKIS